MIASSTTRPIARTSPQSVSVLIEKPKAAIIAKVATSETGIASIGMIVARNALQEHEDDDQDQHERLDERVLDLADVLAHVLGRVVGDPVLEPGGKLSGQAVHALRGPGGRCRGHWRRRTGRSGCVPAGLPLSQPAVS